MGSRLDELEHSIASLMEQAGLHSTGATATRTSAEGSGNETSDKV